MTNVQTVGTDQIIHLSDVALVASATQPGGWHEVRGGRCDCRGYLFRGHCRHVDSVVQLEREAIRAEYAARGWPSRGLGEWY